MGKPGILEEMIGKVGELVPCTFCEGTNSNFHLWTKEVKLLSIQKDIRKAIIKDDGETKIVGVDSLVSFDDALTYGTSSKNAQTTPTKR